MKLMWQLEYQTHTDWPYTYELRDADEAWSPNLACISQYKSGKQWKYDLIVWEVPSSRPQRRVTFTSLKKAQAVGLAIVRLTN